MLNKLKQEFDKNPTQTLAVTALAVTAVSQFVNALSAAQGRRAYAKQVKYRVKNG